MLTFKLAMTMGNVSKSYNISIDASNAWAFVEPDFLILW